jgi:dihydroorotate dehydrogenase
MVAGVAAEGAVIALGMAFPSPVGLAAGFDRTASKLDEILGWGFGFLELGTVTPKAVPGRNPGVAALAATLAHSAVLARPIGERPVVGVNLGVQPGVAVEHAWLDYLRGMQAVWPSADYLALNFTSSDAQALRSRARRCTLLALLAHAQEEQQRLSAASRRRVPLLIKWPVGPVSEDAAGIAQRVRALGYDGMIAAFESAGLLDPAWEDWAPGACRRIARTFGPRMTLIAVGGIDRVQRALALRDAGAGLVQMYRGFQELGPPGVRAVAGAWRLRQTASTAPA